MDPIADFRYTIDETECCDRPKLLTLSNTHKLRLPRLMPGLFTMEQHIGYLAYLSVCYVLSQRKTSGLMLINSLMPLIEHISLSDRVLIAKEIQEACDRGDADLSVYRDLLVALGAMQVDRQTEVFDYVRSLSDVKLSRGEASAIIRFLLQHMNKVLDPNGWEELTVEDFCRQIWDSDRRVREYNGAD